MPERRAASDPAVQQALGRKTHKYSAKRTIVDGIMFDSKREAARYQELRLLEKAGEIRHLIVQPRFPLHAALTLADISRERDPALIGEYVGDFMFEERLVSKGGPVGLRREWRTVVEDVKGMKGLPLYRWKVKHLALEYHVCVREVR